ncbi:unnamed protein product, partial [Musa textilis]
PSSSVHQRLPFSHFNSQYLTILVEERLGSEKGWILPQNISSRRNFKEGGAENEVSSC